VTVNVFKYESLGDEEKIICISVEANDITSQSPSTQHTKGTDEVDKHTVQYRLTLETTRCEK